MIKIGGIAGKKYFVLGLGKSGLAAAASLLDSGAEAFVWDDKETARKGAEERGFKIADPFAFDFKGCEAVVVSPGVPLAYPTPHPAVEKCKNAGVPAIGELELLAKACPEATYIGVTGTNGKSTTTALIAHILKSAGFKTQVGGNLGTPALQLETLESDGFYVLEMSSYQLDLMRKNPFKIAVLLNITPDHIDRHGSMEGYIAAKEKIAISSSPLTFVVGTDEKVTAELAARGRARADVSVKEISLKRDVAEGFVAKDGAIYSCTGNSRSAVIRNASLEMPRLPGTHNHQNICAAFAVCRAAGVQDDKIVAGLRSFPGLAHRQQLAAEINGVRFINDSKATNADASSKALACYDDIYWIIGGRPKSGGLDGLEQFAPKIRHAFLIGEAAEQFAEWCKGKTSFTHCGTLENAVKKAASMALEDRIKGAVVLLSPACASFDQFSSFEERGDMFIDYVRGIAG